LVEYKRQPESNIWEIKIIWSLAETLRRQTSTWQGLMCNFKTGGTIKTPQALSYLLINIRRFRFRFRFIRIVARRLKITKVSQ